MLSFENSRPKRKAPEASKVHGKMLNRPRANTSFQYQVSGIDRLDSASNQVSRMPAMTGTNTAHRKGLPRAQLDTSISQPMLGSAQIAFTGMPASITPHSFSGSAGPHSSFIGLTSLIQKKPPITASISRCSRMPAAQAIAGASRVAATILVSTVCTSDTGIDFQNSTERSLRSSKRQPIR